jgi:hypothetical protein
VLMSLNVSDYITTSNIQSSTVQYVSDGPGQHSSWFRVVIASPLSVS